jgi:hypothetical protein
VHRAAAGCDRDLRRGTDNAQGPKGRRVAYQRMFAELRLGGNAGGYDAVRHFGRSSAEREGEPTALAYAPQIFGPARPISSTRVARSSSSPG